MNIVFMGTPQFAVPALERLCKSRHTVLAVFAQPDRNRDRKGNLIFGDVKQFALSNSIPVFQYDSVKKDGIKTLRDLHPDIAVTAAYGQILSQELLDIPKYGVINVHASLLPKYRGSAPVQYAVLAGERETGVTIMQTAAGLDTGDILSQRSLSIDMNETAGELLTRLSILGADLLLETLQAIEDGDVRPVPQVEAIATKCFMLKKEDGHIDWSLPAQSIHNRIRAFNPWPVAFTAIQNRLLKLYRSEITGNTASPASKFGEVVVSDVSGGLQVACGDKGILKILSLQLPGKKIMPAADFLRGCPVSVGTVLI